ncbi:AraC family transcriptional regulator [Poseidonocella sp. HB161398]|uniref:AraC family transcriptional regulator n=1 Tax=Poseidonocella sp. HB161398 TaxID=2320855 RepID=UPI0014865E7D|nr:AraC family transcriptional regulator [Poseidonocella sp. HB161398]
MEFCPTGLEGVTITREPGTVPMRPVHLCPVMSLVLSGQKRIRYGDRDVLFGPGDLLVVSHDLYLPAAIGEGPFLSLDCAVDFPILRAQQGEIEPHLLDRARADAVARGTPERDVLEGMRRILDLAGHPEHRRVLLPLLKAELHFRVQMAEAGGMLRNLSRAGSHASRVTRAIAHIKAHWNETIQMAELAQCAAMGASAFHAHFKAVAGTTPLQFQKSMRMYEARRRLRETQDGVAEICRAVGYESPTQFSRDYRRTFGHPPISEREDAASERAALKSA